MSTTASVENKTSRIKGPAGFLHVEQQGAGGIPVVFLHSFGGSTSHWKKQVDHLSDERQTVAFDFRGHGKSELPSDKNYAAEALAADIAPVVDDIGLNRVVLVGHSMGGTAAIAYAAQHPERVAGLVLAGTPGKSSPKQSSAVVASLQSEQYQKVMDDYMKQLLTDAKPDVNETVSMHFRAIKKDASIEIIRSMFEYDPLPSLNSYTGPKLIISTTREKSQPAALQNQMKDMPVKTLDGTSHWMQLDKPEEFNKILDDFLKTIK